MIVFSLLLILVAVTLLVVGLTGGSSSLLIASIVASLVAAIALVIGARQASAARRAAALGPDDPIEGIPLDTDPGPAEPTARRRTFRRRAAEQPVPPADIDDAQAVPAGPDHAEAAAYAAGGHDTAGAPSQGAPMTPDTESSGPASATHEPDFTGTAGAGYGSEGSGGSDFAGSAGAGSAGYGFGASSDEAPAFHGTSASGSARDHDPYGEASADDEAGLGGASAGTLPGSAPGTSPGASAGASPGSPPGTPPGTSPGASSGAERQRGRRSGDLAEQPDYDRAATFIGGARAQDEDRDDLWARDPAAAKAEAALDADIGATGARADVPGASAGSGAAFPSGADGPGVAGGIVGDGSGYSDGSGLSEEFGEPDPDDPADEPLPQAIRATDAVRVGRMDAEVLVVDGRPRYHFADCPHLVGRLTEPLSVSEAVELGFSPCGLCRPVDRLVAAATRR